MLEKLKYRGSLRKRWNYDVTAQKEAERFLQAMAMEGYTLKKIAGSSSALFIKTEDFRPVYTVTAAGNLSEEKREALVEEHETLGWEFVSDQNGLYIFKADRRQRPESVPQPRKLTLEEMRESVKDNYKIGNEVMSFFLLLLTLLTMVSPNSADQPFALILQEPLYLLIAAFYFISILTKLLARHFSLKNLENRLSGERDFASSSAYFICDRILSGLYLAFMVIIFGVMTLSYWDMRRTALAALLLVGLYITVSELPFLVEKKEGNALISTLIVGLIVAFVIVVI